MSIAKKPLSPILFYGIILLLFFVDFAAYSLFEKPLIYSLLCFYIIQLARPMSLARIVITCLLLSLLPLIQYGRFGLELIYVVPATLIGIKMRHTLYDSYWQYYLLLAICILTQVILIEYAILHLAISLPYTFSTLFANILLIWLMGHIKV